MIYRREFDGLRAIAVIAVVIYHLNARYLPNGFLGVDIFLVLSGFLITSIIQGKLEKKFSMLEFLKKRFFRIYPAYFTVICLVLIVGVILLPQAALEILKSSVIYSFLGLPNFFYYRNINESYFEINSIYPLLHLWSLGLELQFYFIWAIILAMANKFRLNLRYFITILSCSSFVIAIYFYSHSTSIFFLGHEFIIGKKFVFYLLPARIWEFGIGALASLYTCDLSKYNICRSNESFVIRNIFSKSFNDHPLFKMEPCTFPKEMQRESHPPHSSTVSYFKRSLLFLQNLNRTESNHIFSIIGIVLVFLSLFFFKTDEFSPYIAALPCIGTFLLIVCSSKNDIVYKVLSSKYLVAIGILSYSLYLWHFPLIEFFKYFYETYHLVLQIITILCVIVLALISYKFVESYYRNTKSLLSFSKYCTVLVVSIMFFYQYNQDDLTSDFYKFTSDYPGSCLYHPGDDKINNFDKKRCTIGATSYIPNILLVGSSHSNNFVPFLAEFSKKYKFSFINITANSTGYTKKYLLGKPFENDQSRIKLHDTFYKLIKGIESDFDVLITCPSWANTEKKVFSETLEDWSHKFKMIVLINHIPTPNKFKLMRRIVQKPMNFSSSNYSSSFLEREAKKYNNVYIISINDLILEKNGLDDQGHALLFDAGHLNIGGGIYLAKRIIQDKKQYLFKSSKFLSIARAKDSHKDISL